MQNNLVYKQTLLFNSKIVSKIKKTHNYQKINK